MSDNLQEGLPFGWAVTTLDSFCKVIQGQSPPGDTYNTEKNGLPFFQGKSEFGSLYPIPVKWCSLPTKVVEADDILISIRAPVGPTNLCPSTACIGRGLAGIRPLGNVSTKFVLYGLRNSQQKLVEKGTGSTFEAISGTELRSHKLVLAPIAEQHRIVAEIEKQFSRLDAGVVALKRIKANLKRYRASVLRAACEGRLVPTEAEFARQEGREYEPADALLQRILCERRARWEADQLAKLEAQGRLPLNDTWKAKYQEPATPDISSLPELPEGWCWTTLLSIADIKGGITKGQQRRPDERLRNVPYLRVANVQRGYIDLSEIKYIEATEEEITQLSLQLGDVLFNEGGDRDKLGRGWIWNAQLPECIHQNHVFRARLFIAFMQPKYLSWYGNTMGVKYFIEQGKQTTNLASINMTKLGALPIPLPPLPEQRRIVAEVERRLSIVEEVETTVNANLKRAERLRQAILQRAFAGKLVPQDPADEPASVLLERIQAEHTIAAEPRQITRSKKRMPNIISQSELPL